ncbi:MAG: ferritin-like domain-containing protein [Rubrivivax sp.]|nr:ferritin-like domain-containing protein [Rubrivivax sp.]
MPELRAQALALLALTDPEEKAAGVRALDLHGRLDAHVRLEEPEGLPGRPERPLLVPPSQVRPRPVNTLAGRATLLHALAHIEFNAINLALDIAWRFDGLPEAFHRDWLRVAQEEALHFTLLRDHLRTLGHDYGDFPGHDALWEMATKTRGDVLARVALVPRTLETRGLDASPPIKAKLVAVGDHRAGEILDVILRDEIGHVALGNHWYRTLCEQRGLDPVATYAALAGTHRAPRPKGPFNVVARRAAGFTEPEIEALLRP